MSASDKQQLVEHKPGLAGNDRSRPLKTGKGFILVVGLPRVIQLRWDRASYDPGDPCQLILDGSHLGKKPLDLTIEVEDEHGAWSTVATMQALVDGSEARAVADWKFPVPPGYAAAVAARAEAKKGRFIRAQWGRTELTAGDTVTAHVEAHQLEGAALVFLVEREAADGSWRNVTHWEGSIKGGKCTAEWRTPPPPEQTDGGGELLECRFEDGTDLSGAHTAWLVAKGAQLDGALADIVLEREQGDGQWVPVGKALSTVKAGQARAGIPLPRRTALAEAASPESSTGRLLQARWQEAAITAGATVKLAVEAEGFEGAGVVFLIEREAPDGNWRYHAHVEGAIEGGRCEVEWQVPAAAKGKSEGGAAGAGSLLECRFEDGTDLTAGQTAWLVAKGGGLDGRLVDIVLELEQGENEWVSVGNAISTVKVGEAHAGIPLVSE